MNKPFILGNDYTSFVKVCDDAGEPVDLRSATLRLEIRKNGQLVNTDLIEITTPTEPDQPFTVFIPSEQLPLFGLGKCTTVKLFLTVNGVEISPSETLIKVVK